MASQSTIDREAEAQTQTTDIPVSQAACSTDDTVQVPVEGQQGQTEVEEEDDENFVTEPRMTCNETPRSQRICKKIGWARDPDYTPDHSVYAHEGNNHYHTNYKLSMTVRECIELLKTTFKLEGNISLWMNNVKLDLDKTMEEAGVKTDKKYLPGVDLDLTYDDAEPTRVPYEKTIIDDKTIALIEKIKASRRLEKEAEEKARQELEDANKW